MSWGGGAGWGPDDARPRHLARSAPAPQMRQASGRDRLVVLLVVLVLAAVAGAIFVVGGTADDDSVLTAPTTTLPPGPALVFDTAADRLSSSGGFTYRFQGRWEIEPPDTGQAELITEEGEGTVRLPGSAQHSVTDNDGSRRDVRVVDGRTFARASAFPDQIEQRPWVDFEDLGGAADMFVPTALPDWLAAATDHRDGGEDTEGRVVVKASVPPSLLTPAALDLGDTGEQTLTGDLELTVDGELRPVRVVVAATTQSAVVRLEFDGIEPVADAAVAAPPEDQIDATPLLNEEDIAVVQAGGSLGLGGIPEGWFLVSGQVTPDLQDPACSSVELMYAGLGGRFDAESGPENFLVLTMFPMSCAAAFDPSDGDFSAGDNDGVATESADGSFGALLVGETEVDFASSLSLVDLEIVLATLGPVDLAADPEEIDGIPSDPA